MDLERLVKTHNNTEIEYERVELVDRIKSLQEIILEEARFDISSNGNKSTNELNSKLQNEIDRLQKELAKERDDNLLITKDKYSVYEKLRESELNKHKITKEYESIIKKKSDEFKTIIDLLQADLDTENSKNKELKSSIDLKNSKIDELNSRVTHLNQINKESKETLSIVSVNLAEEILKSKKLQADSQVDSVKINSLEKSDQEKCGEIEKLKKKLKDLESEYETSKKTFNENRRMSEEALNAIKDTVVIKQNELKFLNDVHDEAMRRFEEVKTFSKSLEECKIGLELKIKDLSERNNILVIENSKKDFVINKNYSFLENFDKFYEQYFTSLQKLTQISNDEKKCDDLLYESILCSNEFEEKKENISDLKRKLTENNNVTFSGKKSPEPNFSNDQKPQAPIQVKYNKKHKYNSNFSQNPKFCEDSKLEDFNFY